MKFLKVQLQKKPQKLMKSGLKGVKTFLSKKNRFACPFSIVETENKNKNKNKSKTRVGMFAHHAQHHF